MNMRFVDLGGRFLISVDKVPNPVRAVGTLPRKS